ncbi:hypothetical protein BDF20DRAFT_890315 [Mycotypha africana]|uniref:uncharacterized protein n=1 Tax=Mycotypha africana TaxID=64632 RepID=UPI0022FFFBB2|nr:uncharacterized protein BDF20DRAFT_890315 [Mycotypha africana]KAI8970283.1 hypothetical protein BDF20DRAFT_890315 [Mycotypha africana]
MGLVSYLLLLLQRRLLWIVSLLLCIHRLLFVRFLLHYWRAIARREYRVVYTPLTFSFVVHASLCFSVGYTSISLTLPPF